MLSASWKRTLFSLVTVQLLVASAHADQPHLRVALTGNVVTWVDPAAVKAAATPLIDVIAKKIKKTYYITTVTDESELLAQMRSGKVNYAYGGVREYVELADKIKLVPVVKARAMGSDTFKIQLLVRRGSGIAKVAQLRGKRISIIEKERIYRIYLDVLLAQSGIKDPGDFFVTTRKKKKLKSVVLELLLGESDACVVSNTIVKAMTKLNPRLKKKLVVLHSSEPIANPPLFGLAAVDKKLTKLAREIAIDLHNSTHGQQLLMMFKTERMVPAKDSDYDTFRELLKEYKRLQAKKP